MAEKLALAKVKRNRALAQAWIKRHTSPKGHTPIAGRR
jgi:hypothetical protein